MLKTVDILWTTAEGQKRIGEVVWNGTEIQIRGSSGLKAALEAGILGRSKNGTLYPKDGLKFLEELQFAFTGSYLRATKPKEEKSGVWSEVNPR